jgi:hypothetical protein
MLLGLNKLTWEIMTRLMLDFDMFFYGPLIRRSFTVLNLIYNYYMFIYACINCGIS